MMIYLGGLFPYLTLIFLSDYVLPPEGRVLKLLCIYTIYKENTCFRVAFLLLIILLNKFSYKNVVLLV